MKKTSLRRPTVQALLGFALLLLGLYRIFFSSLQTVHAAIMMALTLGLSLLLGFLIRRFAYTTAERTSQQEQNAIEAEDERNARLREKAAYATHPVVFAALCAMVLVVCFVLPPNLPVVLMALGLLCLQSFLPLLLAAWYARRM